MPRLLITAGAVLAATMLLAAPAKAGYLTGAELASLCRANVGGHGHVIEAAECLGYIVGVADTFDCVEALHGFHWDSKQDISQPQLVSTVVRWIEAHPSAQSYESDGLVAAALAEAYPCTSQQ